MQNRATILRIVLVALMLYALLNFASARAELERTRQMELAFETEYEGLAE